MSDTHIKEAHNLVEEAKRIAGFPALLHKFLDSAAEAVVIVDQHANIVFFNRRASFLFGWLPEEVLGKPIEILLPDELQERHVGHRRGFMAEPYTRAMGANLDLKGRHKDGTTFPILIDLQPENGTDGIYVRAAIKRKSEPEPAGLSAATASRMDYEARKGGSGSCPFPLPAEPDEQTEDG